MWRSPLFASTERLRITLSPVRRNGLDHNPAFCGREALGDGTNLPRRQSARGTHGHTSTPDARRSVAADRLHAERLYDFPSSADLHFKRIGRWLGEGRRKVVEAPSSCTRSTPSPGVPGSNGIRRHGLDVVLAWTSVSMDAGGEAPRRIEGSGSSACGMSESISDRTVTSWRR